MSKMSFTVFAFVCLTITPLVNAAELSGTPEELRSYLKAETRTVTLNESATEVAYTDLAKITLVVSTEAKDLALAMKDNNELRDAIRLRLSDLGVKADDIQSSKYSASPQYGWFGKKPAKYNVVNSLIVTVDSDELFRGVAGIADANDDVAFAGVAFEHSKKAEFEDKVRDKALQAVMRNKDYFAAQLGLTLRPVQFGFSAVDSRPPRADFAVLEEIVVTAQRQSVGSKAGPVRASAPSFNEVTYRVSVSVTFAISDTG